MKKLTCLLLALFTAAATFIAVPAPKAVALDAWSYGGKGTVNDPYTISNAAELQAFGSAICSTAYSGAYFALTEDIDLNPGYTFSFHEASGVINVYHNGSTVYCIGTGIAGTLYNNGGSSSNAASLYTAAAMTGTLEPYTGETAQIWHPGANTNKFNGTLDGKGHTVFGLYQTGDVPASFFYNLDGNATVKNLTLDNGFIGSPRGANNSSARKGAFVGQMNGNAKLINCVNRITVASGKHVVGGIASMMMSVNNKLIGCVNYGNVVGKIPSGSTDILQTCVGGIVGQMRAGSIVGCVNYGDVYCFGENAGGIAGLADTGWNNHAGAFDLYFYGCANYGKITSDYLIAEGVTGGKKAGGIIGYLDVYWSNEGTDVVLDHCYNEGEIVCVTPEGYVPQLGTVVGFLGSVYPNTTSSMHSYLPCSASVTARNCYYAPVDGLTHISSYETRKNDNNLRITLENCSELSRGDSTFMYDLGKFVLEANELIIKKGYTESALWYDDGGKIITVQDTVFGNSKYVPFSHKATESDPIPVKTVDDLLLILSMVESGHKLYGMQFELSEDIDLSKVANWTPIGFGPRSETPAKSFGGRLYSTSGATIKGMKIASASSDPVGFFGALTGVVENVTFAACTVSSVKYGGIVSGVNLGRIINCSTDENCSLTLNAATAATAISQELKHAAGSAAAINYGEVIGFKNYADVVSNQTETGGVVGSSKSGRLERCINYGDVTGAYVLGGVLGYNGSTTKYGASTVTLCGNHGKVTASGGHVAGLVGWSSFGGGISLSYNLGNVSANSQVAGLTSCGNNNASFADTTVVIEKCFNAGTITMAGAVRTSNTDIFWSQDSISAANRLVYSNTSGNYTTKVISAADFANGNFAKLFAQATGCEEFSQIIGKDIAPVLDHNVKIIYLDAPKALGRMMNSDEGSFVGYVDYSGKLYAPDETVTASAVSPVYVKGLYLEYGAGVRTQTAGDTGIRYAASLNTEELDTLDLGVTGKGVIILPTAYITGENATVNGVSVAPAYVADDFTKEALIAKGLRYVDVKVDGFTQEGIYRASLINIYAENYALAYSARAYVTVDINGYPTNIYGGWENVKGNVIYDSYADMKTGNSRTISQVAKSALSDLKREQTGKYVHAVSAANDVFIAADQSYGSATYYSPYSAEARKTMAGYFASTAEVTERQENFYPEYPSGARYSSMKKTLKDWVYGKLKNETLFSVKLKTVAGVHSSSSTVSFAQLKARWTKSPITDGLDADGNETLSVTYTDTATGLRFVTTAVLYKDNPSVEFTTTAENTSGSRSPVLYDFYAMDQSYTINPSGSGLKLHTTIGSSAKASDFELVEANLSSTAVTYTPQRGGMSTSGGWPFFDIVGENCGIMLAVGWSGQWQGSFTASGGTANIKLRQQNFSSFLEPGEKVIMPNIIMTYFDGDAEYGHNVFRELILQHYTPDDNTERKFAAPIALNFWGGTYAAAIKDCVNNYAKAGVEADLVWMDAGWYGNMMSTGTSANIELLTEERIAQMFAENKFSTYNWQTWSWNLGRWTENPTMFPNGIGEVGEAVDKANELYGTKYRFLLWYMIENLERETVFTDTDQSGLRYSSPETVAEAIFGESSYHTARPTTNARMRILRLDDEAVYQKVLSYYKMMIDENGLDAVRVDSSSEFVSSWVNNDKQYMSSVAPSVSENCRLGFTENKYIHNFYRLWRELKEYYPDFILDNCCSGGRRIDINMAKIGVPLWRTDYNSTGAADYYEAQQAMSQRLAYWLPLTAIGCPTHTSNLYVRRSFYSPAVCVQGLSGSNMVSATMMNWLVSEFVELRPYWYGNYYQLLPVTALKTDWQAYQLYREDLCEGMAVVIRRDNAPGDEKTIKLKGLASGAVYLLHDIDDLEGIHDRILSGRELMTEGITVSLGAKSAKCYKISLVNG